MKTMNGPRIVSRANEFRQQREKTRRRASYVATPIFDAAKILATLFLSRETDVALEQRSQLGLNQIWSAMACL
jgi:hypothetical protein